MAHLRKTPKSPYWYLRYRDLDDGYWKEQNLKLRHDDAKESAKALKIAAKKTQEENIVRPTQGQDFAQWVPAYIKRHYVKPVTCRRALFFWQNLNTWLLSKGIRHPRHLKYHHAGEYMDWRKGNGASHNTARVEVKFLSFLMKEAIRMEYAERNVIGGEIIKIVPAKVKPDLTEEDIQKARMAFLNEKEEKWMRVCFEILIHVGCRFNESRIPRERIDFKNLSMQIEDSKRDADDPRKLFTIPISQQLATFLKGIEWYDGFTLPSLDMRQMNRKFNRTLGRACGATSHSCRVTFISRCHRAGLTQAQAMRLVNHSTEMVHRIYSRLNVEDARMALEKVPSLSPPLKDEI